MDIQVWNRTKINNDAVCLHTGGEETNRIITLMYRQEGDGMEASITVVQRLRINYDGKGVRTVVFFHGCPLNCKWCCNPETRFGDRHQMVSLTRLHRIVDRDYVYHRATGGGVTFSGGEALLHAEYIHEYLKQYKKDISAAIETSLYAPYEAVELLIPYIDEWHIDLKNMDDAQHAEQTGVSNERILTNLKRLCEAIDPDRITIAYPFIPTQNDAAENVEKMIAFMKENGLKTVRILPHRKYTERKYEQLAIDHATFPRVEAEQLDAVRAMFGQSGITVGAPWSPVSKEKCELLKGIRIAYCDEHALPIDIPQCTFEGRCLGTCPRCESELKQINCHRYGL